MYFLHLQCIEKFFAAVNSDFQNGEKSPLFNFEIIIFTPKKCLRPCKNVQPPGVTPPPYIKAKLFGLK